MIPGGTRFKSGLFTNFAPESDFFSSLLEVVCEIIQPDGSADSVPVALQRAIGLARLSGDERNDRDLRLVQGSALDRLLSDKGLRSRMASELAKNDVRDELTTEAQAANTAFERESLPTGLDLAITGGQCASIASMIGLTADRYGVQLPLASCGAGTRRLSALAIAEQNQGDVPITLVDEVGRGLEPYRQRALVEGLQTGSSRGLSDDPQSRCDLGRGQFLGLVRGPYRTNRASRRNQDREAPQDQS